MRDDDVETLLLRRMRFFRKDTGLYDRRRILAHNLSSSARAFEKKEATSSVFSLRTRSSLRSGCCLDDEEGFSDDDEEEEENEY